MVDGNLYALTLLLRLFQNLSTTPVEDDTEFAREVLLRWRLWREQEGWTLKACGLLDGYYELHLREQVLGVRVFKNAGGPEPVCIARLRILLNGQGLVNSAIDFADDPDAKLVAARLLEVISLEGPLRPLERSLARGLTHFVLPSDLMVNL